GAYAGGALPARCRAAVHGRYALHLRMRPVRSPGRRSAPDVPQPARHVGSAARRDRRLPGPRLRRPAGLDPRRGKARQSLLPAEDHRRVRRLSDASTLTMQRVLTPEIIVSAYVQGIYPMADEDGSIGWYSPEWRAVFPLDAFRVPRSLAKALRKRPFEIRIDTHFEEVIRGCAARAVTWISEEIVRAYTELHRLGLAHSVEAWQRERLVGGLYGVALGGAFMGESMFSRVDNASGACLVALVERLKARGYVLLDSQTPTRHLLRFGQTLIP